MSEQRIFITGGASGFGEALADRYAKDKWSVCIGDLNEDRGIVVAKRLNAAGVRAQFLRCDVRKEEDIQAAADWMQKNWGGVDAVINNAGVAVAGPFEDTLLSDWDWIIDINLMGVVRGSKIFGKIFQTQGHGHIVNIASAAGLVHLPLMASYNVTKAGVVALSETLRVEYPKIKVSVVCPTFFKTNLAETLRSSDKSIIAEVGQLVTQSKVTASSIAEIVFQAIQNNEFLILPDANARKARNLKKILPDFLFLKAIKMEIKNMQRMKAKTSAAKS
ncbi:MAG: SDR family oxidoreductase [Oligoflexus sp.]|nr:SDR family oxidoreductase [Oligoflexus sp.]